MRGRAVVAGVVGVGFGWLCGPILPYAALAFETAVATPMTGGETSPAFVLALLLPGVGLVFGTLLLVMRAGHAGRVRERQAPRGSGVLRAFGLGWLAGALTGAGAFYFAVPG